MDPLQETPLRPRDVDVSALIGMLAVLEGELWDPQDDESLPDWARRLPERFSRHGLVKADATSNELRAALNGLNHRLRYVRGEYDQPPTTP